MQLHEKNRIDALSELVAFPPRFMAYAPLIEKHRQLVDKAFQPGATCRGSVFIMTKYPDGADMQRDTELQAVIDTVKDAVSGCGFHPSMANAADLHPNLWENVEVHMLACSRGIAIVESKFRPDLNPNVAMEWGWMRAMEAGSVPCRERREGDACRRRRADQETLRLAEPEGRHSCYRRRSSPGGLNPPGLPFSRPRHARAPALYHFAPARLRGITGSETRPGCQQLTHHGRHGSLQSRPRRPYLDLWT